MADSFSAFLLQWKELCLLHKIPGDISEVLQEYLFHQRKDCSAAVRETLLFFPHQSFKHPLVLSLTSSLTSFCDWIRKSRDVCSSSTSVRFFRLLYSLGISIYFLRLIFEMSSEQSAMRLHSLPIAVRKGVVQCLAIIGFNCSDYQVMISSPEAAELTSLLAEKFYLLFPEIISPSNLLNQRLVICFFHSYYNSSCPCLVEDLFGDMEDINPSPLSNLGDHVRHSKLLKEEIPVLATPPSNSPLTKLSLHVGALTTKNERNALLSRCRTSPMNGHRLALERRLQKQPVAQNHSLPVSNSVKDVEISKKRSCTQESNLNGNNRRRLIVEDTPVRNSSK